MGFAEHQTFYIREGWLFKGMAAIRAAEAEGQLPTIFQDRDAAEKLGIGQNMVRSLRFWMRATGLAEERLESRQRTQRLTELGEAVWEHDRYLEDAATLWLIHFHLACSQAHATTWYWFFNHFTSVNFDESSCLDALSQWVITTRPDQEIAASSLKKDVDCLLRTYDANGALHTPEDLSESPLARLRLLSSLGSGRSKRYRLERPEPAYLPPLVLLYVLVSRQAHARPSTPQVGLSSVLREPMNAGQVFNLTTSSLVDLVTELNALYQDWRVNFVRTAGLDHLTLPRCTPNEILARYYSQRYKVLRGA